MKKLILILLVCISSKATAQTDLDRLTKIAQDIISDSTLNTPFFKYCKEHNELELTKQKKDADSTGLIGNLLLCDGLINVRIRKANLNKNQKEEYILQFNYSSAARYGVDIYVLDGKTFEILDFKGFLVNEESTLYFAKIRSEAFYDIVFEHDIQSTYAQYEYKILSLLDKNLKTTFNCKSVLYDWKDYGKDNYGHYKRKLTDNESYRLSSEISFIKNNNHEPRLIKRIAVEEIVNEPESQHFNYKEYKSVELISKKVTFYKWSKTQDEFVKTESRLD